MHWHTGTGKVYTRTSAPWLHMNTSTHTHCLSLNSEVNIVSGAIVVHTVWWSEVTNFAIG